MLRSGGGRTAAETSDGSPSGSSQSSPLSGRSTGFAVAGGVGTARSSLSEDLSAASPWGVRASYAPWGRQSPELAVEEEPRPAVKSPPSPVTQGPRGRMRTPPVLDLGAPPALISRVSTVPSALDDLAAQPEVRSRSQTLACRPEGAAAPGLGSPVGGPTARRSTPLLGRPTLALLDTAGGDPAAGAHLGGREEEEGMGRSEEEEGMGRSEEEEGMGRSRSLTVAAGLSGGPRERRRSGAGMPAASPPPLAGLGRRMDGDDASSLQPPAVSFRRTPPDIVVQPPGGTPPCSHAAAPVVPEEDPLPLPRLAKQQQGRGELGNAGARRMGFGGTRAWAPFEGGALPGDVADKASSIDEHELMEAERLVSDDTCRSLNATQPQIEPLCPQTVVSIGVPGRLDSLEDMPVAVRSEWNVRQFKQHVQRYLRLRYDRTWTYYVGSKELDDEEAPLDGVLGDAGDRATPRVIVRARWVRLEERQARAAQAPMPATPEPPSDPSDALAAALASGSPSRARAALRTSPLPAGALASVLSECCAAGDTARAAVLLEAGVPGEPAHCAAKIRRADDAPQAPLEDACPPFASAVLALAGAASGSADPALRKASSHAAYLPLEDPPKKPLEYGAVSWTSAPQGSGHLADAAPNENRKGLLHDLFPPYASAVLALADAPACSERTTDAPTRCAPMTPLEDVFPPYASAVLALADVAAPPVQHAVGMPSEALCAPDAPGSRQPVSMNDALIAIEDVFPPFACAVLALAETSASNRRRAAVGNGSRPRPVVTDEVLPKSEEASPTFPCAGLTLADAAPRVHVQEPTAPLGIVVLRLHSPRSQYPGLSVIEAALSDTTDALADVSPGRRKGVLPPHAGPPVPLKDVFPPYACAMLALADATASSRCATGPAVGEVLEGVTPCLISGPVDDMRLENVPLPYACAAPSSANASVCSQRAARTPTGGTQAVPLDDVFPPYACSVLALAVATPPPDDHDEHVGGSVAVGEDAKCLLHDVFPPYASSVLALATASQQSADIRAGAPPGSSDPVPPCPYASAQSAALQTPSALTPEEPETGDSPEACSVPLAAAAAAGQEAAAVLLLSYGVDVDVVDPATQWTPLQLAAHHGHQGMCAVLLAKGAAPNRAAPPDGRTPLALAAAQNHTRACVTLLTHGACIDLADHAGWTPLMHASHAGHVQTAHLLRAMGARPMA